jgi:hypothetical protein
MDGIDGAPFRQFFQRPAKVLEDLAVDVLDLAYRRHDRDQAGNGFDDQARLALAVLKITVKARIFEGGGRLGREQLEESHPGRREGAGSQVVLQVNHPDQPGLPEQRHTQN